MQFACIALCFWNVNFESLLQLPLVRTLVCVALITGGIANGVWALWAMGSNTFSVLPKPVANGTLCISGPYQWLAHPMYSSVLMICLSAVIINPTGWRIAVFILLVIVLAGKLKFEEGLLARRFSDYESYRKARHRLVPGIW